MAFPTAHEGLPACLANKGADEDLPLNSRVSSGSMCNFNEVAEGDGNVSRELSGLKEEAKARHVGRWRNPDRSGSLDDSTDIDGFLLLLRRVYDSDCEDCEPLAVALFLSVCRLRNFSHTSLRRYFCTPEAGKLKISGYFTLG